MMLIRQLKISVPDGKIRQNYHRTKWIPSARHPLNAELMWPVLLLIEIYIYRNGLLLRATRRMWRANLCRQDPFFRFNFPTSSIITFAPKPIIFSLFSSPSLSATLTLCKTTTPPTQRPHSTSAHYRLATLWHRYFSH